MKIALTGGIACGKSEIIQQFKTLGAGVISLDKLSRDVVQVGESALNELIDSFGNSILYADQSLNRVALREILLKNSTNKQKIEAILHPKILEKMQIEIEKLNNKLIIIEIPLLLEKKLAYLFDRAIIVSCSAENQLKRLLKRQNIDNNTAKQLISVQISQEQQLELEKELPIDILENNSEIFDLEKKVDTLYQKLINL
ncbi:dephospho-CoA kinase [Candidatus Thioglobus sp.]|jgi:dephospho-CoA kinase|uniref:dephospho-CoA kinase n=1 Tax=Candidatus Thioglobus sp. TaxID=2026721 RepID=UPI0025C50D8B|nr:dephospho-CoA kinase [Candidatus Thioglobus sp.]